MDGRSAKLTIDLLLLIILIFDGSEEESGFVRKKETVWFLDKSLSKAGRCRQKLIHQVFISS